MSLRIVVLVKHSPDASSERKFTAANAVDRSSGNVLSELDVYAVEQALRLIDSGLDASITYLTMGPAGAVEALRKALSMGGDAGVHICDDALAGADALATSLVLARALQHIGFDLVIGGMGSTEAGMGLIPAMLSERLGVAQATLASEIQSLGDNAITVRRDSDAASEVIKAALPAIVSVTDQTGEPRYPNFKGIIAAKKKPITTLSLSDIGLTNDDVLPATLVRSVTKRPVRQSGRKVSDGGTGAQQLFDFLVAEKLA